MGFDSDFRMVREGTFFIDRTGWMKEMPHMGFVVHGPCGCGKSTLLSMMARFYGEDFNSEKLFRDTAIGRDKEYCSKHMNKYPVIYVSFRDFNSETYYHARRYMEYKMTEIYHNFMHRFLDNHVLGWQDTNFYLDILQGKADEGMLGYSLTRLLNFFDRPNRRENVPKPILLIDDYNRLVWNARKNGYENQMTALCKNWLNNRLNDYTEYFAVTGELHGGKDNDYYYNGQEDILASCIDDSGFRDYFLLAESEAGKDGRDIGREVQRYHNIVHEKRPWYAYGENFDRKKPECGEFFTYGIPRQSGSRAEIQGKLLLDERDLELIFDNRKQALEEEYSECRRRLSEFRKHQADYASPFPADIDIGTKFAGTRKVPDWPNNAAYAKRDKIIRDFYSYYEKNGVDEESIYIKLQNVDEEKQTDWFSTGGEPRLSGIMEKHSGRWSRIKRDSSTYWEQVSALKNKEDNAGIRYLKVYISTADCKVTDVFLDAVERLLDSSANSFWAKVSLKKGMKAYVSG